MKKKYVIILLTLSLLRCGSIPTIDTSNIYEVYINSTKIGTTPATYTLESNINYSIVYKNDNNQISKELKLDKKRTVTFKVLNGRTLYTDIITGESIYF